MFRTHPPLPSAEEIRAFRRDPQALHAAINLRNDLAQSIRLLQPETLLELAGQFFPGEGDFQALAKFGLEVTAFLRELAAHGEDVRAIAGAEAERLAPVVAAACRRDLAIMSKLGVVDAQLRLMDVHVEERRANLQKAGVVGKDAERVLAEGSEERAASRTALNEERAALLAEQEALGRFLTTRDERHLPTGFEVSEPIKVSAPHPAPPAMAPHYRAAA